TSIEVVYGQKCDRMLEALEKYDPESVAWRRAEGGLFVGVTVAGHIKTSKLLERAVEQKVAFIPGTPFFCDGSGENAMRLNFSNASFEQIDTGIARLGRVIKEAGA